MKAMGTQIIGKFGLKLRKSSRIWPRATGECSSRRIEKGNLLQQSRKYGADAEKFCAVCQRQFGKRGLGVLG